MTGLTHCLHWLLQEFSHFCFCIFLTFPFPSLEFFLPAHSLNSDIPHRSILRLPLFSFIRYCSFNPQLGVEVSKTCGPFILIFLSDTCWASPPEWYIRLSHHGFPMPLLFKPVSLSMTLILSGSPNLESFSHSLLWLSHQPCLYCFMDNLWWCCAHHCYRYIATLCRSWNLVVVFQRRLLLSHT